MKIFCSILIAVGIIGFVSLGILTVANAQPATGAISSENEQLVLEFMENGYPSLGSRQSIRRQ